MNTQTITSAGTGGGAGGNSASAANTPQIIYLNQQPTNDPHTLANSAGNHLHSHQQSQQQQHLSLHHQLIQSPIETATETTKTSSDTAATTYQMSQMQPVTSELTQHTQTPFLLQNSTHHTQNASNVIVGDVANGTVTSHSTLLDQNQNVSPKLDASQLDDEQLPQFDRSNASLSYPATRFKWTNEKTQVAMNLVKHGCKPKLISVAVGCSLRTAQKFAETVSPKIEGEAFKVYEIKRRGRKSKDVNHRLNAIREVLSKDSNKTQVEIAADLRVSNTTVCRDLKRLGASWKEKKHGGQSSSTTGIDLDDNGQQTDAANPTQQQQQPNTRKTRQSNTRQNSTNNNTNDTNDLNSPKTRKRTRRNAKSDNDNDLAGQDHQLTAAATTGMNQ